MNIMMDESPEMIVLLGQIEMLQMDEQDETEREAMNKKRLRGLTLTRLDLQNPISIKSSIQDEVRSIAGLPNRPRAMVLQAMM